MDSPDSVISAFIGLHFFRLFFSIAGIMMSFHSKSPWLFVLHALLLLLTVLEAVAAGSSRTSNLGKKRIWTISNLGLYCASILTVVSCIVVRIFTEEGNHRGGKLWPEKHAFFLTPDIFYFALAVGEFFTLPLMRIRNWRTLPSDEGLIVGDSIPVIAYRDEEEEEEEETGLLAEAFRTQQEQRDPGSLSSPASVPQLEV